MKPPLLLLFLLSLCPLVSSLNFSSIGVRGQLLCGTVPTPGIRIKLWDDDMGELVDQPPENAFTDMEGKFELSDWTLHNEENDPMIRIAHDCNDGLKKGQRLFKWKIPRAYVVEGKDVDKEKYFDLGVINLEVKPYNEERYTGGDYGKRKRRSHRRYVHRLRRSNVDIENRTMSSTSSPFHGLDDGPDERNEPW